jgi:hypothetical protein
MSEQAVKASPRSRVPLTSHLGDRTEDSGYADMKVIIDHGIRLADAKARRSRSPVYSTCAIDAVQEAQITV